MNQVKTYTTAEIRYDTQGGAFVALEEHESTVAALRDELAQAEVTRASWQNGYDVRGQEIQLLVAKNKALQERLEGAALPALAKGFNTLEQKGGKYTINLAFDNRDDAWAAYQELSDMNSHPVTPVPGYVHSIQTVTKSTESGAGDHQKPCRQPQAHPARCGCEE